MKIAETDLKQPTSTSITTASAVTVSEPTSRDVTAGKEGFYDIKYAICVVIMPSVRCNNCERMEGS